MILACPAHSSGDCYGFQHRQTSQSQVREQWNKCGQTRDTVGSAIELTCNIAFNGAHTARACFFRAVTIFLCYAPDRDWKLGEELQGWGVGEDRQAGLYVEVLDVQWMASEVINHVIGHGSYPE